MWKNCANKLKCWAIRWADQVLFEDLPVFYHLADVVVSIPKTDGMPVTLFEAMACHTPVIVGDLPAYNQVIDDGQTGLRIPLQNPDALAAAILRIAKEDILTHRIVSQSQDILKRYGIFDIQMERM
jgi:glycosyltransferase involved in cell wall biosynthesis